jgi:hypothetical protein
VPREYGEGVLAMSKASVTVRCPNPPYKITRILPGQIMQLSVETKPAGALRAFAPLSMAVVSASQTVTTGNPIEDVVIPVGTWKYRIEIPSTPLQYPSTWLDTPHVLPGSFMVLIRIQYDAYNRQFKIVDRELAHTLKDGETYMLIADISIKDLETKPSADVEAGLLAGGDVNISASQKTRSPIKVHELPPVV